MPLLRAAPWPALTAGSAGGALLMLLVAGQPRFAALLPIAIALLAGSAALVLDEPAAAAVDAAPTSLRRRTAARSLAALAPLVVGALCLTAVDRRAAELPLQALLPALAASVLLALALASALRRRIATPGETAGAAVALGLVTLALFDPLARWWVALPAGGDVSARTPLVWAVVAAGSLIVLGWTTRDLLRRGLSRRGPGRDRGSTAAPAAGPWTSGR